MTVSEATDAAPAMRDDGEDQDEHQRDHREQDERGTPRGGHALAALRRPGERNDVADDRRHAAGDAESAAADQPAPTRRSAPWLRLRTARQAGGPSRRAVDVGRSRVARALPGGVVAGALTDHQGGGENVPSR